VILKQAVTFACEIGMVLMVIYLLYVRDTICLIWSFSLLIII